MEKYAARHHPAGDHHCSSGSLAFFLLVVMVLC
jgi:hypothetical protein